MLFLESRMLHEVLATHSGIIEDYLGIIEIPPGFVKVQPDDDIEISRNRRS
jgi:hypothetical protein